MTIAWFDVSAGVAGDMLLGALVDAGAPLGAVQDAVDAVLPGGVRLSVAQVDRAGQRAAKLGVELLEASSPHRSWASIRALLTDADLAEATSARALAVFERLAWAEGRVHGVAADDVHFHEVGALDSIADVVGACEALRLLGVDEVRASGVALGSGRVRAAHGDMPVPVPAVVELMVGWPVVAVAGEALAPEHVPTHDHESGPVDHHHGHHHHAHDHGQDADPHHHLPHDQPAPLTASGLGELATPTGVALMRALASYADGPEGVVRAVGVGAGGRNPAGRPNVVRVVLTDAPSGPATADPTTERSAGPTTASNAAPDAGLEELAANVDDLDPRLWPSVIDALLDAGALDAWLTPIVMKKGRPAHTVHALVARERADAVADVLLTRTSTLGVRHLPVARRTTLERAFVDVDVLGRPVTIKVGHRDGRVVHATAEWASVMTAAQALGRPEADIAQRAAAALVAAGLGAGDPWPAHT